MDQQAVNEPLLPPVLNEESGVGGREESEERDERVGRGKKSWTRETALCCLYIALYSFKPSEAFLVDFLSTKGVDGVSVFYVFTYSRGPALLLCLLLCRILGCKAVVVAGAVCSLITTALTLTTSKLLLLQVSQASVAFAFASLIGFEALQFNGAKHTFQMVSHLTKGFMLASCCGSSLLGQTLREYVGDKTLFTITLFFEGMACLVALFLPAGANSVLRSKEGSKEGGEGWRHVWFALKKGEIFRWTLLWTLCYAVHDLVLTNWQVLAQMKLNEHYGSSSRMNLNGYMWSAGYLLSALLTLGTSSFKRLYQYCAFVMVGAPLLMGMALFVMGVGTILPFYISFIFFQTAFQLMAAVRNASLAKSVTEEVENLAGLQNVDTTFVLSAVLWFAGGTGVAFESSVQVSIQYLASLSFANQVVWKALASCLFLLSFMFASYFLRRKTLEKE